MAQNTDLDVADPSVVSVRRETAGKGKIIFGENQQSSHLVPVLLMRGQSFPTPWGVCGSLQNLMDAKNYDLRHGEVQSVNKSETLDHNQTPSSQ